MLHKRDPLNPFYEWLSIGASDRLVDRVAAQIPADGKHPRRQWSTMRADAEKAWGESMGWEFVFLANEVLQTPP